MSKKKIEIRNNRLDGFRELSIIGDIGDYDAQYISDSINNLSDENWDAAKNLRININSYGGDVLCGFSIISSMQKFMTAGGIIETVNEGRADSTAGWIFACGTKGYRKIMQYAGVFTHAPMYANGQTLKDLLPGTPEYEDLNNYFDKLINIFVQATGNTYDSIKNFMINETDFSAADAVKVGFADKVILVNNAPVFKNSVTREQVVNITSKLKIEPIVNINNNFKKGKMNKLAVLLNLNAEASDEAIQAEVEKIINAKKKAESDLQNKTADFDRVNAELTNANKELATVKNQALNDYVDALIKEDDTKKDMKEALVNMAKTSGLETFKKAMPLKNSTSTNDNPAIIDNGIENHNNNADEQGIKDAKEFKGMTSEQKKELRNSDSAKYNKLVNAYEKNIDKII